MKPISTPDLSTRPYELKVERTMDAAPEVLFKAWTKQFDLWFAVSGSVIMEGEVNTAFFFETAFEEKRYPHYGRFLRLEQDCLIEITWITGKGGTMGAETVVTVELEAINGGTYLSLTHAGFLDEESKNQHEMAWPHILVQLDKRMAEHSSDQE